MGGFPKQTPSEDGVKRIDLLVPCRLTLHQMATILVSSQADERQCYVEIQLMDKRKMIDMIKSEVRVCGLEVPHQRVQERNLEPIVAQVKELLKERFKYVE